MKHLNRPGITPTPLFQIAIDFMIILKFLNITGSNSIPYNQAAQLILTSIRDKISSRDK